MTSATTGFEGRGSRWYRDFVASGSAFLPTCGPDSCITVEVSRVILEPRRCTHSVRSLRLPHVYSLEALLL